MLAKNEYYKINNEEGEKVVLPVIMIRMLMSTLSLFIEATAFARIG